MENKPLYAPASCRECMKKMGIKKPEYMYDTELCVLHINSEWSEELVKAIDLLKKSKITAEDYKKIRISCNLK